MLTCMLSLNHILNRSLSVNFNLQFTFVLSLSISLQSCLQSPSYLEWVQGHPSVMELCETSRRKSSRSDRPFQQTAHGLKTISNNVLFSATTIVLNPSGFSLSTILIPFPCLCSRANGNCNLPSQYILTLHLKSTTHTSAGV